MDLPQPLAPTSVMMSLSCMSRLTPSSAVTTEAPVSKLFVTDVMLILATECLALVPGEEKITNQDDEPVAQEPE